MIEEDGVPPDGPEGSHRTIDPADQDADRAAPVSA
jgi:hypothetical protein